MSGNANAVRVILSGPRKSKIEVREKTRVMVSEAKRWHPKCSWVSFRQKSLPPHIKQMFSLFVDCHWFRFRHKRHPRPFSRAFEPHFYIVPRFNPTNSETAHMLWEFPRSMMKQLIWRRPVPQQTYKKGNMCNAILPATSTDAMILSVTAKEGHCRDLHSFCVKLM